MAAPMNMAAAIGTVKTQLQTWREVPPHVNEVSEFIGCNAMYAIAMERPAEYIDYALQAIDMSLEDTRIGPFRRFAQTRAYC